MYLPVREMTKEKIEANAGKPKLKIPKELWRLVDYIYKHGMRENGLFQESGNPRDFEIIREKLDTGESMDDYGKRERAPSKLLILLSP